MNKCRHVMAQKAHCMQSLTTHMCLGAVAWFYLARLHCVPFVMWFCPSPASYLTQRVSEAEIFSCLISLIQIWLIWSFFLDIRSWLMMLHSSWYIIRSLHSMFYFENWPDSLCCIYVWLPAQHDLLCAAFCQSKIDYEDSIVGRVKQRAASGMLMKVSGGMTDIQLPWSALLYSRNVMQPCSWAVIHN